MHQLRTLVPAGLVSKAAVPKIFTGSSPAVFVGSTASPGDSFGCVLSFATVRTVTAALLVVPGASTEATGCAGAAAGALGAAAGALGGASAAAVALVGAVAGAPGSTGAAAAALGGAGGGAAGALFLTALSREATSCLSSLNFWNAR